MPKTIKLGDNGGSALKFRNSVYLAGLDNSREDIPVHPAVFTAGLRKGFVGCVNDVKVDGRYFYIAVMFYIAVLSFSKLHSNISFILFMYIGILFILHQNNNH